MVKEAPESDMQSDKEAILAGDFCYPRRLDNQGSIWKRRHLKIQVPGASRSQDTTQQNTVRGADRPLSCTSTGLLTEGATYGAPLGRGRYAALHTDDLVTEEAPEDKA